MNILVGCEHSQRITNELRKRGHNAFSCDIIDCTGNHPEWHIKDDIFKVIHFNDWDMMIVHPPCTYLSVAGAWAMYNKDGSINQDRKEKQLKALEFVDKLMNADIERICVENPVSVISSQIRKPDQIIQPYMFGDNDSKKTCLWLKNLQPLIPTDIIKPDDIIYKEWTDKKTGKIKRQSMNSYKGKWTKNYQHNRAITYNGIAQAMAEQWTNDITIN